jgi:hypothetical protein
MNPVLVEALKAALTELLKGLIPNRDLHVAVTLIIDIGAEKD